MGPKQEIYYLLLKDFALGSCYVVFLYAYSEALNRDPVAPRLFQNLYHFW